MAFNITPQSLIANAASGINLLSNSLSLDIVAIIDQETLQQVFEKARPIKATIKETAKVMDYPVETGVVLSDHKITNPNEIEMVFIIGYDDYSSAYQAMRNAWLNATSLSVQTRTGTYRNMIIQSLPHEENPEMYNAVQITVMFREVIFVAPISTAQPDALANYEPTNPIYNSTVNKGLLSPITGSTAVYSYFRTLNLWGL